MTKKIVAVTACPTGIAHTFMAAEALEKAAKERGVEIKVETRGSGGVENELTAAEIREAHAVILACDVDVPKGRFAGKPTVTVGVSAAIKNAGALLDQALAKEAPAAETTPEVEVEAHGQPGVYRHLMSGVSHMLPFVVAGGIIIALSFVFGIEAADVEGSLAAALMQIGGGSAFALMVPVLAGYIAYSIADRPGLAPGAIGGMIAGQIGAGFLGGIVAGFLAGYLAKFISDIKMGRTGESLKPILITPLFASLVTGLLLIFVIGKPITALMGGLTNWLTGLSGTNAAVLGLILGAMMAFDMGGPLNKVAYTFAVGLLGSGVYAPQAAVMAAGMTPPLGIFLAALIAPKKFTADERQAGKVAGIMGISFITEGAIPFAAADPLRVIPSLMAGSAVAGALSMAFGATLRAPHGGIFVLPIPNVVGNLGMYVVALLAGTVVTALLLSVLKKEKA